MENIYNLEKFEIIYCECGRDYIAKGHKKHLKTIKHKEFMKTKPQPVLVH